MTDILEMRRQAETPVVASQADYPAVAKDLAEAFMDDVMFNWFMRTDGRRVEAQHRLFNLLITRMAASGKARVDRPAGGGAAAVWLPFSAVGPMSFIEELRALPTMLFATGLSRLGRLMAVQSDMDKNHPVARPHAYLWFLGVAPAAQGHGVGSALLRHANARLDAAGEPAYLETQTERNIALYKRHGFEVISEHRPRPDAPLLWSLWREPRDPSHA